VILTFALLSATVMLDVSGQVFFKLGVGHDDGSGAADDQRRDVG
jgi:hypothetical protein